MSTVSLVSGAIGFGIAIIILYLVRRDHLPSRSALAWVIAALVFSMSSFIPMFFNKLAGKVGIAYPPTLALTVGLAIVVIKLLLMDIARSRQEARMQILTQRIAILESEIKANS